MAQSFTCPSCGAPLNYNGDGSSTIACPYCYTSVIVPPELRTQQAQPVAADVSSALSGQAHKLRELSNLIRTKQGAQAIALYQQVYGVDNATAQQLVSQLLAASSMVLTGGGHSIKFNTTDGSLNVDTSSGWPNTGSGGYSNNPPSYIPTSPSNYTVSPQPTVYTTRASTGGGASRLGWAIGCVVVLGVLVALGGAIVPFAIGGLSFLSAGSSVVDTPVSIKLPNINATTTAAFALATKAALKPTKEPASSATPSSTPEPTEDFNGTATAQALSIDNEQVSAQAKLPVFFSDNFTAKRSTWQTGPDNNDYFTGTRAIANGTYIWTFNAKRDVASFVYPINIKPTKDFYTSVDVKITGPADSDAGLVFRHKSDDTGWYYFAIGGDGRYSLSYYGDSGWETLISLTDSSAVKPGVNTLAVAAQDIHLVMLINDQVVGSLDDDRITSGDVGLAAEIANAGDSGIFTFDNFQILANK